MPFLISHCVLCAQPISSSLIWSISLIIFNVKYELWSFLLFSFLHPCVTVSLVVPNGLLSSLFSDTVGLCSSLRICLLTCLFVCLFNHTLSSADCTASHYRMTSKQVIGKDVEGSSWVVIWVTEICLEGLQETMRNLVVMPCCWSTVWCWDLRDTKYKFFWNNLKRLFQQSSVRVKDKHIKQQVKF